MKLIWTLTIFSLMSSSGCTLDGSLTNLYSESEALLNTSTLDKIYAANSSIELKWKVQVDKVASKLVSIEESRDGGATWSLIAEVPAANEGYSWVVPNSNIEQYRAKATYKSFEGSLVTIVSSENMIIDSQPPSVVLLSPVGNALIKGGSLAAIKWEAHDVSFPIQPIQLSYSVDGGNAWTNIASSIENMGTFDWTVPLLESSSVKIKVRATDTLGLVTELVSVENFSVDSTPPALNLIYPLGNEILLGDSTLPIRWSSQDPNFSSSPIKIEISSDGGVTWSVISESTENDGVQNWSINISDTLFAKIRISSTDILGHRSSVTSDNFTISRSLPKIALNQSNKVYSNTNTYTYSGTCDLGPSMADTSITVVGPSGTTSIDCNGSSPLGTWSYATDSYSVDGERNYSFSQTNMLPLTTTLNTSWVRDNTPPTVMAVLINNGSEYASSPFINVAVTANDNYPFPLKTRLIEVDGSSGDCSFSAGSYLEQNQTSVSHPFTLSSGFIDKKICVYVEDLAGNRSVMSDPSGTNGIDSDGIKFEIGNPPQITYLNAYNPINSTTKFNQGDVVKIDWTITDAEGLDRNPVSLEYTTNGNTWIPIVSNYGSLATNQTSYSGSYSGFAAPSASFFQIRLKGKDYAGNNSIRITSNTLNSGAWSIYAGTLDTGIGNTAKTTSLENKDSKANQFAIHPRTGDLYVVSDHVGLIKIDNKTGISSKIINWNEKALGFTEPNWSEFNFPEEGEVMPANIKMTTYLIGMSFDNKGRLYLNFAHSQVSTNIGAYSTRIYQIDLDQKTARWYAGGGNSTSAGILPRELSTVYAPLAFDEDNSLYTMVLCNPQSSSSPHKLVKITQNTAGLAENVSYVAGNCNAGTPANAVSATNTPFYGGSFANYGSLSVWDHGNKIYYTVFGGRAYKIIGGISYHTSFTTTSSYRGIVYNPIKNVLHLSHAGGVADTSITTWSIPSAGQSGGELLIATEASGAGTNGNCLEDGIAATSACIIASQTLKVNSQGVLLFTDGFLTLSPRPFRIRYVDESLKMQTIAGTLPFYGKDLDKSVMRTSGLGSIHYKTTTEDGSIYTPGLYFIDSTGQVFGRIKEDNRIEILWGNQRRFTGYHAGNIQTNADTPIGVPYANDGQVMGFDPMGLPWIRYNRRLISLTSTGTLVERQTASTAWTDVAVGGNPSTVGVHVYGLHQNLFFKKNSVFMMGRYYTPSNLDADAPYLRLFDFDNLSVSPIMGGQGGNISAPDSEVDTDLTNQNLSAKCINQFCSLQFMENNSSIVADDKLYFSEGRTLRVITNPTTPGLQRIQTLFTESRPHPSDVTSKYVGFDNFFVTPDQSKVFYIFANQVYCRTLSGTSSWCTGESLNLSSAFGTFEKRANQITMLDSTTLLINTGRIILKYKFPPGP